MRWFTDAVYEGEDDDWDRNVGGYATRLAEIVPRLPADLAALATDPRLDLHDGRFQEVTVDLEAQEVTMVIDGGDLLVGYHRLTLHFRGATIVRTTSNASLRPSARSSVRTTGTRVEP